MALIKNEKGALIRRKRGIYEKEKGARVNIKGALIRSEKWHS